MEPIVTIVTAWYRVKNKYGSHDFYQEWMSYFFKITKSNLIVYTDELSVSDLEPYRGLPNVHIILKEISQFWTYQYLSCWEENTLVSRREHPYVSLQMNMVWNEKLNFLASAVQSNLVSTPWVMWLDIGYFRCNKSNHIPAHRISEFPNGQHILSLNENKVYIGSVSTESEYKRIKKVVTKRSADQVPLKPWKVVNACLIAGGCMLMSTRLIPFFHSLFYAQLERYLCTGTYVKDDQIIYTDVVLNNPERFVLVVNDRGLLPHQHEPWMMFQRFLL